MNYVLAREARRAGRGCPFLAPPQSPPPPPRTLLVVWAEAGREEAW